MEKVEEIVEKYRNTLRALANKSRNVDEVWRQLRLVDQAVMNSVERELQPIGNA